MMDIVALHTITLCRTVIVPPYPSNGNTRITEVCYLIVSNAIIAGIKNNYPYCTWKYISTVTDNIIIDYNILCYIIFILIDYCLSYFYSSGTKIVYITTCDLAIAARSSEPESVCPCISYFAIAEGDIPGKIKRYDCINRSSCLGSFISIVRHLVACDFKIKVFKSYIFNQLAGGFIPMYSNKII